MTNYRIVARHVRYWRGAVHKWSTVWPFTGTLSSSSYAAAIAAVAAMENKVNWDLRTGSINGCLWEIALYNQASGGVPQAVATYADPDTPGTWVRYTSTGWTADSGVYETAAEVALDVRWQAGLSSSGKPVYFRKWFHSVPAANGSGGTRDVAAGNVTSLAAALTAGVNAVGGLGAPMGNGGRLAALTPIVDLYYGNHQMPRGRRRHTSSSQAKVDGNYSAILGIINGEAKD